MNPLLLAIGKGSPFAALAAFIIWKLVEGLPSIEAQGQILESEITKVQVQHETIQKFIENDSENQKVYSEGMMKLMRGVCLNTAQTKDELKNCNN